MPLLNKEPFVPVPVPDNLSPDDEVFYLPLTNEIFTSHDAFFERSILTNSLVWTCSVSGRSALTFEEALESESQAKILIQTFPQSMRIPILYLIRYLTTPASRDICDMIYAFVCNRYFLGETVDIIKNDQRLSGQIIKVIPPSDEESRRCLEENQGKTSSYGVDPHLYKYQIQVTEGQDKIHLLMNNKRVSHSEDGHQEETSEALEKRNASEQDANNDSDIIIEASCIIRPRGMFSKDRLKLFLRHHLAETKRNQVFGIKEETKELYNLNDVTWNDIFDGPEPKFDRKSNVLVKIKEPTITKDTSIKITKQTGEDEDAQRKRKVSEIGGENDGEEPPKKKKKKKKDKEQGKDKDKEKEEGTDTNSENSIKKKKKKKQKEGESWNNDSNNDTVDKPKKKGPKPKEPKDGSLETPTPKKKKKYPYDPHKYDMPVPANIDPDLLTSTGKIDGRKLKNKKNKDLAEELFAARTPVENSSPKKRGPKPGSHKKKSQEREVENPEKVPKKKSKTPVEIAKEKELEAKRKKEAALLVRQLEKQKREEERKAIASFLQEWDKKCEDLERDDLRPLPLATPIDCDIPQEHFGDALYIMEVFYNFHEIFSDLKDVCPNGVDFDTLEEILLDRNDDGALGTIVQYLLTFIFRIQSTQDGLGHEDDTKESLPHKSLAIADNLTNNKSASSTPPSGSDQTIIGDQEGEITENGVDGVSDIDEDEHNKEIDMNDLIGSAIRAAQIVQASINQPLNEIELDPSNVTEVLRLHLLQSGTYPKSRSVYNGWYSAREDPGLWLCMQEPELLKKLSETTIFDLNVEERVKLIHALINQVFSFLSTRAYIETASERLSELRKEYRATAAAFARWERENCVKKMQQPKRKNDQTAVSEKSDHETQDQEGSAHADQDQSDHAVVKVNGEVKKLGLVESSLRGDNEISDPRIANGNIKSCLKINGHNVNGDDADIDEKFSNDESIVPAKKRITFMLDSAITTNGDEKAGVITNGIMTNGNNTNDLNGEQEPTFEDLEKAYEENLVAYDEYQAERSRRLEELNSQLLLLRTSIRNVQSLYGIHPIGRDRAFRRYWLFQSLPGLFVELDETNPGSCLSEPTPTESRFKLKFNRDNPSDPQNNAIKQKSSSEANQTNSDLNGVSIEENIENSSMIKMNGDSDNNSNDHPSSTKSDVTNNQFDVMARCCADETHCTIHEKKNSESQPRWWFYHSAESINSLIETLNKRGYRESELLETLIAEKSTIREWVSKCPSFKLNKLILEQSGIRRSRRLRLKTHKRRTRAVSYD